jgi:hypothetical protein
MTPKMTAKSMMATMLVLGCLGTPAFAGEPFADTTSMAYDNQFEVYSAADLESWWRHYAPIAAAQKVGPPSDAAQSASADDQSLESDKVARLQAPDRSEAEWKEVMAELKEQRTMLIEQGREIGRLQALLHGTVPAQTASAE